MFSKLVKDTTNGSSLCLAWVFGLDQNIFQVYNDKDIELFNKNSVSIALKTDKSVG